MSTARLNPPRVLLDDSSPSNTSPPEPGKAYIPLTPPTGLSLLVKEPFSLEDTGAQTFIVDLKSLGDDGSKSAPVREHQIDVNHPPAPPHELPKEDPLPFPSVDSNAIPPGVSPNSNSNSSDSTGIGTPIQPPGLPLLGESQTDDSKSASVGEHSIDANHLPPPHELPEQDPLPFPSVYSDATPAGVPPTSNSSDSASVGTPIQPPGLPLHVDANPVEADKEEVLSAVEDRDTGHATSSCFSLTGLETLRTCIPDDLFPEHLLVHDPNNLTNLGVVQSQSQSSPDTPVRYVRIFPKILREGGSQSLQKPAYVDRPPAQAGDRPVRAAHLYLKNDNKLGGGHHSSVYSAPLRLRLNPESHEESTVRVAVKTADARCGAHKMLRREAAAYNAFPRHLMEDRLSDGGAHPTTGEVEDAPSPSPISSSSDASSGTDAGDERPHTPMHQPAVVPKFFGYYAAVDADGNAIDHWHPCCDIDDRCRVSGWPTRLLLVEECGKPIVLRELPYDQRKCCLELFKRLHAAGFTQGSIYARNILVQPGPLSAPPEERSAKTPSFRIIDFGRVQMRAELSPGRFSEERVEEEEWAMNVLM